MSNVNTASYRDNLQRNVLNRSGSLIPTVNNAFDFGSSSLNWRNIYATSITSSLFGTSSNTLISVSSSFSTTSSLSISSSYSTFSPTSLSASYALSSSHIIPGPVLLINAGLTNQPTLELTGNIILVSSASAQLFDTPTANGTLKNYFLQSASLSASMTGSTYFIVADYNSGNPRFDILDNRAGITGTNIITVATINRTIYNSFEYITIDDLAFGMGNKLNKRFIRTWRFAWETGLALGESGSRYITATSGTVWYGATSIDIASTNTFTTPYRFFFHVGGEWTSSLTTQYNNTQYDDGTNLVSLSGFGTRYAVNFVYRSVSSGDTYVVLGTGNYLLFQAVASQPPANLPNVLSPQTGLSILIGRIIVANGASSATEIDSTFVTLFTPSPASDHNALSNLQGGQVNEYYHLTSAEYTGVGTGVFVRQSGSLEGTASWANNSRNSISSSFLNGNATASIFGTSSNAVSSSYSLTASFALTSPSAGGGTTLFTGSTYQITSSWANNSISSSFLNGNATASLFGTASNAVSSSYALTASFALSSPSSEGGTTLFTGSTYQITSSWSNNSISSSFLNGNATASLFGTSSNAVSASYAVSSSKLTSDSNAFIQDGNSFGAAGILGTNDNNALQLEVNNTTAVTIQPTGSGWVGIGANPVANLYVSKVDTASIDAVSISNARTGSSGFSQGMSITVAPNSHGTRFVGAAIVSTISNNAAPSQYATAIDARSNIQGNQSASLMIGVQGITQIQNTGSATTAHGFSAQTNFIGSGSLGNLYHYYVDGRKFANYVSNSVGLFVQFNEANDTAYGIFLNPATASSTYGIWQEGTSDHNFFRGPITGTLFGTSSWSNNSVTSSYSISASKLTPDSNAFLQGGNSFGAAATMGTLDNNLLTFVANQNRWMSISSTGRISLGTLNPSTFFQVTMRNSQSSFPRTILVETDTSTNGTTGSYTDAIGAQIGCTVGLQNTVDITSDITALSLFTTLTGTTRVFPIVYGANSVMTLNQSCSVTSSVGYQTNMQGFITNNPFSSTIINAKGFNSIIRNVGSRGTIVSASGFFVETNVAHSASYGVYINRTSASNAAGQFGVYQLGTDNTNYFEGPIVGSASYCSLITCSSVTGSGTNYSLTQTSARVDFGQGDTDVLLPGAGTYEVTAMVQIVGTTSGDEVRAKLRNTTNNIDITVEPMANVPATNAKVYFYLSNVTTVTGSVSASIFARNVTAARGVVSSSLTSIKYIRLR